MGAKMVKKNVMLVKPGTTYLGGQGVKLLMSFCLLLFSYKKRY